MSVTSHEPTVPPQDLDAEESVLGAMLLSPGAIAAVGEILNAGEFYRESHGIIYKTAIGLYGDGSPEAKGVKAGWSAVGL